jgi:hypothetical protein
VIGQTDQFVSDHLPRPLYPAAAPPRGAPRRLKSG